MKIIQIDPEQVKPRKAHDFMPAKKYKCHKAQGRRHQERPQAMSESRLLSTSRRSLRDT